MNEMGLETIMKKASIPTSLEPVVRDLIEVGLDGGHLDERLGQILGKSPIEANIARLNLIGSLRGSGYEVTGGRSGGKIYRIIGWSQPTESETCESWDRDSRSRLEAIRSLPVITNDYEDWFNERMGVRFNSNHESSWLYLRSYEISDRNEAFAWEGETPGGAAIIQKFKNAPRFNILQLDANWHELADLVRYVGSVSCASVKVMNPRDGDVAGLMSVFPKGHIVRHTQAIYDVKSIAEHPEDYWRSKTVRNMKSALKDTRFYAIRDGAVELQTEVIEQWRIVNEPKQRQLAVRRDYVAAEQPSEGKFVILGMRNDELPVAVHVFDQIDGTPYVAHIVEKALNYSTMPGGRSGTSDLSLWQSCVLLNQFGIEFINGGMIDGGTPGLAEHKKHLACEIRSVQVVDSGERRP